MVNLSKNPFELLFVIVNDGLGSKVLSKAKEIATNTSPMAINCLEILKLVA